MSEQYWTVLEGKLLQIKCCSWSSDQVIWCAGTQNPKVSCQITMHQLYSNLTDDPLKTFATNYTETLLKSLNSKCHTEMSFTCVYLFTWNFAQDVIDGLWCSWDRTDYFEMVLKSFKLHRESKKGRHYTLVHIFAKYWPIFIIFSPTYSAGNLQ